MAAKRLLGLALAMALTLASGTALAQKEQPRDVFLQAIGMLSGQGLVLGHENLEGIAARYDKKLLPKDKALEALTAMGNYADLVLATFKDQLMPQLSENEKKDLSLLIGFYDVQRASANALADYVRTGSAESRKAFENFQAKVAAIIRQIRLGKGAA